MDKWRGVGRLVVLCAVVAGVLAACTPEGGPVVTETPSVSGSPGGVSPSPSPTASVDVLAALPDAARTNDLDGAVATAEFFLTLYAPMFHTGDTRLWEALSGDECGYCADAQANAERVATEGWKATGGDITPDQATSVASQVDEAVIVTLKADFADAYLASSDSTPELQERAARDVVNLRLIRGEGTWIVDAVMVGQQ